MENHGEARVPGVRILILDDDREDAELVQELLKEAPLQLSEARWASSIKEALRLLEDSVPDVCLVDYRLGAGTGIDFLLHPAVVGSDIPVILMTGGGSPEIDRKALEAGAADYFPKERMTPEGLDRAIRYALERRRRRQVEATSRTLMGIVQEVISIIDPASAEIRYISPSVRRVLGYAPQSLEGMSSLELVHPDDREAVTEVMAKVNRAHANRGAFRHRLRHADGSWRVMDTIAENHVQDPGVRGIVASSRDVTDKVEVDRQIRFQATLLDAVGQAVIATDMSGAVTHWSPSAERIYGWTREEAIGQPIVALTTEEGGEERAGKILEEIRLHGSWEGEFRVRRRDGTSFHALVSNSVVRDATGAPIGMLGLSSDITGLKKTEAELQQRIRELRTLTEVGGILNQSDRPIEDRLWEVVQVVPRGTRNPENTELSLLLGTYSIQTRGFDEANRIRSVAVQAHDVTGRMEVSYSGPVLPGGDASSLPQEKQFLDHVGRLVGDAVGRESMQRVLTETFAGIQDALLVVDASPTGMRIRHANPAAMGIFGVSMEELRNESLEFLHVDHDAYLRIEAETAEALRTSGLYAADILMRRKDGTVFDSETTVSLLDRGRGIEGGAIFVIRDVSERTAMEQQLRQMQKMESVGQLAGGIAHDFNNVLTVIRAQVDLLLMDLPDPEVAADLTLIRDAAERAAALTAQLLAFSREQILLPRTLDLAEVVDEAGRLLTRLIGEQIQVKFEMGTDIAPVRIDPNRVVQVILNLAVNSRDAMPKGGTLTFSSWEEELDAAAAAEFPDLTAGRWVVLCVEDTGTGMSAEVARRAFDPFFSTKERGRGTGLGLAMVYGTVKQSGGSIHLETEPGRGTRFLIRLPPADQTPASPGSEGEEPRT